MSKKPIDEQLKDLANTLLNRVSSDEAEDEAESEKSEDAGAEEKALVSDAEGNEEGAEEDATPSISGEALADVLEKVLVRLDERDEQVNALTETVRLLIQASPTSPEKPGNSAKSAGAGNAPSENNFSKLNLRR